MSQEQLRKDVTAGLEQLKSLRDEIKFQVQRASSDLRDEWKALEPKLEKLERDVTKEGEHALVAARTMTQEIGDAFRKFRKRLS